MIGQSMQLSPAPLFTLVVVFALKGTVLLAVSTFAALSLRRASASLRHTLWTFALLAMVIIPLLTLVLPAWRVESLPGLPIGEHIAGKINASLNEPVGIPASPSGDTPSVIATLGALWLGGVALGFLSIVGGLLALRRLAKSAHSLETPGWNSLLLESTVALGITRKIRLLRSDSATMPATWGVFRPVVLLPGDAAEWDEHRRRVVLLHELAHVRRNDCLVQFIAQACCAVYWFHPGVWLVARRIRAEREHACDERVVGAGIDACDYATHLLEIARSFKAPGGMSMAAVAMARPSLLEGRLQAILAERVSPRMSGSRSLNLVAAFVFTALLIPLSAMRSAGGGGNANSPVPEAESVGEEGLGAGNREYSDASKVSATTDAPRDRRHTPPLETRTQTKRADVAYEAPDVGERPVTDARTSVLTGASWKSDLAGVEAVNALNDPRVQASLKALSALDRRSMSLDPSQDGQLQPER